MGASGRSEREPLSRWADLDRPVHYVDYGGPPDGPLLVCLHGLGRSAATWEQVAPALAQTCRVLAIDLTGAGSPQEADAPVTIATYQALLRQFLHETSGIPAVIVGHSMGGTIAAMLASDSPESVAGLVLISPAVPWLQDQIDKWWPSKFSKISELTTNANPLRLVQAPGEADQGLAKLLASTGARVPRITEGFVRSYRAVVGERISKLAARTELVSAARSLTQTLMRREEFTAMIASINIPVLWLHGDRDSVVPLRAAKSIVELNPAWSLHISAGSGHAPQVDAPSWTSERIVAWLSGDGRSAAERARTAARPRTRKRRSARSAQ